VKKTKSDHQDDLERSYRDVRALVDKIEAEKMGSGKEKQLLLILAVVGFAVVGSLGIAMMMGGTKEKDLERHRCETDYQVKKVWDYTEALKKEHPNMAPKDFAGDVDAKRSQFKAEATAACAKK